ncbi:hypothetical protein M0R45_019167 [Rubus argutus]|uniref:Ionotropic glutamate receptor n=1 Tax=Rubus argutus TaxID=59490 RepID=A0AAW1X4P2_RUBAR
MVHSREPAGTYDDLFTRFKLNKFDAVVGDTTIIAYRTSYVDFTLPYFESGLLSYGSWNIVITRSSGVQDSNKLAQLFGFLFLLWFLHIRRRW